MRFPPLLAACVMSLTFITNANAGGWYSKDQADKGMLVFNNNCAQCHRPDLTGAMGPALKGKTFKSRWGGKSVEDLFTFEHDKMPAVNPGSMPKDQIMLITAYLLQKNGLPAGKQPLTEDRAKTLTIPNS